MGMRFHAEEGLVKNLICRKNINNSELICRTASRLMLLGLSLAIILGLFTANASAQATNVYITPDGNSTGNCTSNPHSVAWFNSSGNWGSGSAQIGPGTTVHLCGTFTSELDPQGNGTSASRITLFFEPGANFSKPVWSSQALYWSGRSYWIIDGGSPCGNASTQCNGFIQNTANGTGLANHVSGTTGIILTGAHDIEIKNLGIYNLYKHTSSSDGTDDPTIAGCVYANGMGANVSIHDGTFHDVGWCINLQSLTGNVNFNFYNMYLYNDSHGIALGGCNASGFNIHDSRISGPVNWDTAGDFYHHDGIHVYPLTNQTCSNINIYNMVFDGDWGVNNTSPLFLENHPGENVVNFTVYNSVFKNSGSHGWNNGINLVGHTNGKVYNNTVLCGPGGGLGLQVGGSGMDVRNNLISGCTTFFSTSNEQSSVSQFNNNAYINPGSNGNAAFVFNGQSTNSGNSLSSQLTQFRGMLGGSFENASVTGTGSVDSLGVPQVGSVVIGAGSNLTALGIPTLDLDGQGVPRPSSGPWDPGAFATGSSATHPAPPTGLSAIVD